MSISEQIDKNGQQKGEKQKKNMEQQSRCDQKMHEQQQVDNNRKSILKLSLNALQYKRDFIRDRNTRSILSFMQRFNQQEITFLSDSKIPLQIQVQHVYSSKSGRMVHYNVRISYFLVRVKVFNTIEEDNYKLQFNTQINHGMFGTVYSILNPFSKQEQVAIKIIPYNNQPYKIIENTIKEYALMKVLAAIQVGPLTIKLFGYDLVATHNGVMFSMEKGVPLNLWVSSGVSKQNIQQAFESLQLDLLLLHSLNICHNDIKPSNILYSQNLRKLIYIDFGFTQVRPQGLGYMGMCHAKGSLYYCSEEMKNIFLTTGEGYVDMYYNDYICLKKSKQFILNNYLYTDTKDKTHHISQCHFGDDSHQSRQNLTQIDCFADIMTIYLAYIIEEVNLKQFDAFISQRSWAVSLIEQNMKKVCLFFLQVQLSLGLWHMFNKFSQIFITDNLSLNPQVKKLVEQSLKPYFKEFLSSTFTSIPDSAQIVISNIQFQKKMLKRYNKVDTNNLKSKVLLSKKGLQEDEWYSLDLGEEDEEVLRSHFTRLRSLHYYQQKQLAETLIGVFNRRRWYLLNEQDINLLEQCFQLGNINISYDRIVYRSMQEIYRLYLQLFSKYIKFMHRSFDLKAMIANSVKYYYQQTPVFINLANSLLSKSNNNSENNINQKSIPHYQYNYIEILQLYIFLSQKMFNAYEKIFEYDQNINNFKEYIGIFENKVGECLQLREIFERVDELKIVNYLIEILIERYVIFTYQAALRGYIIAYHKCDYQSYFNIHLQLNQIKTRIYYQSYQNISSQRLRQVKVAQHIDEFINLMTFVDLVPVTHSSKFHVIKRFQLFVKRIQWFQKLVNIAQISSLNFNAKLRLFSLYINGKQILKAIKLGNDLINQSAFTKSQLCVFFVQSLFKRLNNSNQLKLMSKKLQTLKFSQFITKSNHKQLTMEKALIMLQYEIPLSMKQRQCTKIPSDQRHVTKIPNYQRHDSPMPMIQEHQIQKICQRNYIEKIQETWIKCISGQWYQKKFTEKFFLLRTIIGKLVVLGVRVRGYVEEYFKQMQRYQMHLSKKIMKTKDLVIHLYDMGEQTARSKQVITDDTQGEFMIIEFQYFLRCLLNFHNKISQQGLVEECWVRYELEYNRRFNDLYSSEAITQFHAQLKCKFNQYIYRRNYFRWKLVETNGRQNGRAFFNHQADSEQIQQKVKTIYGQVPNTSNEHIKQKQLDFEIQDQKHVDIKQVKYRMQESRRRFEESAVSYIRDFNKQLLDHDFYILTLVGLAQQTMLLEQYSSQWARQQIRSYFIYCIRNQQIFYFFYYNHLTKIYMAELLDIAAMQLVQSAQITPQSSLNRMGVQSSQKRIDVQGEQQIDELLITYIFKSFNEFIDTNSCLTYEQIFVNMSIQLKTYLIKYLSPSASTNNCKYTRSNRSKCRQFRREVNQQREIKAVASMEQGFGRILSSVQDSLLKGVGEDRQRGNVWVMMYVIKTLLVEYELKIWRGELNELTLHLFTLEHHYHTVIAQIYYILNLSYTYQQLTALNLEYTKPQLASNSLAFNNSNAHNLNQSQNWKQRKYYCAVNKVFRKYRVNNVINNQTKYLHAQVVRKIKERFMAKIPNGINHILYIIDKKIANYVGNNLGGKFFILSQ